jgi:transposase
LGGLESLAREQVIDLLYADVAKVSLQGYVPDGWQFEDEDVFVPSGGRAGINCFAFLGRNNECQFELSRKNINSEFIFEQFEQLSMKITKPTVVVLDNAPVHTARLIRNRIEAWQNRGLYLFYLPRYLPHLNIVEILWRKLKGEWLEPADYETKEGLFYAVRQSLVAVGTSLRINFSEFSLG